MDHELIVKLRRRLGVTQGHTAALTKIDGTRCQCWTTSAPKGDFYPSGSFRVFAWSLACMAMKDGDMACCGFGSSFAPPGPRWRWRCASVEHISDAMRAGVAPDRLSTAAESSVARDPMTSTDLCRLCRLLCMICQGGQGSTVPHP